VGVDDFDSLPAWFEEDRDLWFDRCLDEIEKFVVPQTVKGIYPGDLSIQDDITIDNLKSVAGNLYVNGSAVFIAPNLKKIGGKLSVSRNAKYEPN